ncbi:hypothetical protein [Sulfitobacter sp. M368]|uniref:hypothetical protein n=1 Tax=Sulfitobacter sp. M368 TaxID=2867021 RepID=UPI0021A733E5|nr:hypothetical protein [Sulfitobacter sp. M368]UWR13609.1 hypothetical protein K3754_09625 [Sulfitobacter sp. M368]
MDRWTRPNRLTEVTDHVLSKEIVGVFPCPSKKVLSTFSSKLEQVEDGDTVWRVLITTCTGLDKENHGHYYFSTEEEAHEQMGAMPVGFIFGDGSGFPVRFRDICDGLDEVKTLKRLFGAGDHDEVDLVCYDAFFEAGIHDAKFGSPSSRVLDWVGEEDISWMKAAFGENWECVAILEYSMNHFPPTSLVCLAAKLFLARFITYDEFVTGYLVKEIQAIAGGTEQAAVSAVEARKKAGTGGGKASSRRKYKNLDHLMGEIEKLIVAVELVSEQRILQQARESALAKFDTMPTSKSVLDDYEVILRSEEPFKSRYEAVFHRNA